MTNETEIWFVPRMLQVEYIDDRILTTCYRITYGTVQRPSPDPCDSDPYLLVHLEWVVCKLLH